MRVNDSDKRVGTNALLQFVANMTPAGAGFVSALLMARGLGAQGVGRFAIAQGVVAAVATFLTFESWQAALKFATKAREDGDQQRVRAVLFVTLIADCTIGLLGALVVGVGVAIAAAIGWADEESRRIAIVCAAALLFRVTGFPTAVLRMEDRFKYLALSRALGAGVRVVLVLVCFAMNAGVIWFAAAWTLGEVVFGATALISSLACVDGGARAVLRPPSGATLKNLRGEFVRFLLTSNIASTLRFLSKETDVLIVGALLGTEAAGVARLSRDLGRLPGLAGDPLQAAVFPEMAAAVNRRDRSRVSALVVKSGALSATLGLLVVTGMGAVISVSGGAALGTGFEDAGRIVMAYAASSLVFLAGVALLPAIVLMRGPQVLVRVYWMGLVVYVITLPLCLMCIGVAGAPVAQLVFQLAWFAMMGAAVRQDLQTLNG